MSEAERLRAFAKLYGYVRFFHPSDSAATADWDRLAVEGARLALAVEDRVELERALTSWLEGVARTPHVYIEDEGAEPLLLFAGTKAISRDPHVPNVAWQHLGYGGSLIGWPYESGRLRRVRKHPRGPATAWVHQTMDAAQVRGRHISLSAAIRIGARMSSDFGVLFLSVEREHTTHWYTKMVAPAATEDAWQAAMVEADIPDDALSLNLGGYAFGVESVWFDDFELAILNEGDARPIELGNPGFEARKFSPWTTGGGFVTTIERRTSGHALRMRRAFVRARGALFGPRPEPNEILDLPLAAGLRVQLPVSLPEVFARQPLGRAPAAVAPLPGFEDPAARAAAVVVAWNVLNHFYPYFDVIDEDWGAVLDETIADVLDDRDVTDVHATLERLVAKLHDGHGSVSSPPGSSLPEGRLRVRLARIEGQVIVAVAADGLGVERGDRLLEIDGVDIETRLREAATRLSGSPQRVEWLLLDWAAVTRGPLGSMAALTLERRGERIEVELERSEVQPPAPVFTRSPIERFNDGVIRVDLARVSGTELHGLIPELAAAPGVVFDIREYPRSEVEVIIGHLLNASVRDPADWMFTPQIIYPDHAVSGWNGDHWRLTVDRPHIGGPVAFVTGPGAISYAESLLGLVEGYGLGQIIGSPTAGANGNMVDFGVPGGFTIQFTGMKVTRVDGRQHHLVGVEPTIPVTPTLAGFWAGRDEVLEAALAFVRSGQIEHQ